MKIKCLRFPCEICSKVASIQLFYSKSGELKYVRARHYSGQLNSKPQFMYHQQSLQYVERKLVEVPIGKTEIGHVGQQINVDLKKPESISKSISVAGGEGFDPAPCKRFHSQTFLFFLGFYVCSLILFGYSFSEP